MDDARTTPDDTGPANGRSTGVGLRGRLLAAIMLVALTTMAVGAVGISRMSSLSGQAEAVYTDGARPLDGLRSLQADWYTYQTFTAQTYITGLPADQLANAREQQKAALDRVTAGKAAVDRMDLPPAVAKAYGTFKTETTGYLTTLGKLSTTAGAGQAALLTELAQHQAAVGPAIVTAASAMSKAAQDRVREARGAYTSARTLTLLIIGLGLVVSVVLAVLIVRSVMGPVQRVKAVLDQVAGGDLSVRAGATGGAEIGEVALSLDTTLDALSNVLRLVNDSAGRLAGASQKLTAGADAIADNARTAAGQADVVVASAAEVASSVDTVATGSSQMESAIREISQNASEASRVANQAVGVAEETTRTVGKLGDSSREIAAVVKLINGIAEQTNLLALNATIEAARAGESGKGFAVVAGEVKELAQETAKATEDISKRVAAIQADTEGAVEAIGQISTVIGEINDFQAIIAAAVEEQTATTNEMNRNVAEAAGSSQSIASAITGLAAGAQETNARVTDAQQSAAELARMSDELQSAVRRFTV